MTETNPFSSEASSSYASLEALHAVHNELLKRFRTTGNTPEMVADIREFLQRGKLTGALLDSDADRWSAQSQLDYWATQIYQPGLEVPDAILDEFDPNLAPDIDDSLCPFVGLSAFQEKDQSVFFGRERQVSELVGRLRTSRFLAILGSSGSGKSSIVRAGLLPDLKKGVLPGSQDWKIFNPMVPGSNPLENLARLIIASAGNTAPMDAEVEFYRNSSAHLTQVIEDCFNSNVVLVIDQFEEIFTLCTDEVARQSFVNNLIWLCQAPNMEHRVIITMRSDFEMHIARLPELQALFEQNSVRLLPLLANELRESIEAPASRVGLKFEEGVVESLLNDTLGEPAALPLLQFTLLKLWENRDHNRVTWETYRRLGGGRRALARSADEFYNNLIPEDQVTMKRILLKMVRPGEGLEIMSNRIPRTVIYKKSDATDRIDRVLDKLIKERLVRVSEADGTSEEQIEIAHEALVRNWPRLVEWLEEDRVALRQRQRLTTAAEEWQRLNYASSALWQRELLEEARQYDDLNELEKKFMKASSNREQLIRTAGVAGTILAILVLLVMTFMYRGQALENKNLAATAQAASNLAVEQKNQAELQRKNAEKSAKDAKSSAAEALKQAELARASRLVSQAQLILGTQKIKENVGLLLAIESYKREPSLEAAGILQNNPLPALTARLDFDEGINAVALSPKGTFIASGSEAGILRVSDVATGRVILKRQHGTWITSVAFSPDGTYVASGSDDGTVRVWNLSEGTEIASMIQGTQIRSVAFSPDNRYIISTSNDGMARVWEISTRKELLTQGDWITSAAFSPDGKSVVLGSEDSTVRVFEIVTGKEIMKFYHDNWITSVTFNPDGLYVASGSYDGSARIWDISTGLESSRISHGSPVRHVAFSPDGQSLLSSSDGGNVLLSNAFNGETIAAINHDGDVRSLAFSQDGRYMATGVCNSLESNSETGSVTCFQGNVFVWKNNASNNIVTAFNDTWVNTAAFSPDRKFIVYYSANGNIQIAEVATGRKTLSIKQDGVVRYSVAFSPNGGYIASGGCTIDSAGYCSMGTASIWKVDSGEKVFEVTQDGWVNSVAFSPDSQSLAIVGCNKKPKDNNDNTICTEGNVSVFELDNESKPIFNKTPKELISRVVFSPNGQRLASADDGLIRIWDLTDPESKEPTQIAQEGVMALAFSPSGRYLAAGSSDNTVRVWRLEPSQAKEVAQMLHDSGVNTVAFSPDEQYVVSGSSDNTTRVWKIETRKEIARMAQGAELASTVFSVDGHDVFSAGLDGTTRVSKWDPSDFVNITCSRLVRNLTAEEWDKYFAGEKYQAICEKLPTSPTFVAQTILPILLDEQDQDRVQKALQMASSMLEKDSTNSNGSELAKKLVNSLIQSKINGARTDLRSGTIQPTLTFLENAKLMGIKYNESDYDILNFVCWFGSIYGYANEVLPYCDEAVRLSGKSYMVVDSRGLARALTGDVKGAVEDFQSVIDSGALSPDQLEQRSKWIKSLNDGKDPFTPDELETLKSQ
jgi:WD40 repeat protein